MSEIVNLIRLNRDKESVALAGLELQAKERFKSLGLMLNSRWDCAEWLYLKSSQKLKFQLIGGGSLPDQLFSLSKVFLVDVLWNQRLRGEPYSHSYMKSIIYPFKIWAEMGVECFSEINQDLYDDTIIYLKKRYSEPESVGVAVNKVVAYLNENQLLNTHIDAKKIRTVLGKTNKQGRVLAKKEKMPLPELVKAIVHLKWAVDDKFDGSVKAVNDKLCVLTQVFQYGLGLRLGEVLRLPKDPLIEMDGETFCLVWTEKGSAPMARYVPSIWRKPITDAVEEIGSVQNSVSFR